MNSSKMFRRLGVALLAGTLIGVRAVGEDAALPDQRNFLPWEKGSVKFGGFLTAFNSDLWFGGGSSSGLSINAEDVFGLDDTLTVFRAEAMYRPGRSRRHQVDFSYSSYHRDGSAILSEEIDIGGHPVPIGAQVDSLFDFDIIRGTYSFALLQDERVRIAVGLGVYVLPLEYGVVINSASGRTVVEGADTTVPLPALALRGELQLIPKLFLNASLEAMYLEVSDFKGALLDVNLGIEYRPWKHLAFGVGFNGVAMNVEVDDVGSDFPGADFVGTVDVRFSGLMLYGKLSF